MHPFLRRRDKIEPVTFPSAEVEGVLSRTMGVPIFQEQVIQLAMVAAGFSGGEADQLRRAMASWKRSGELEQFEHKLLQGMTARGYSDTFARQIFSQIRGFGEYGFPESHSASFALLAYVSAFLKHYYPVAFCCALLNSQPMGFYSPSQLIQDLRHHGGLVLPVCINLSQWHSTLERQTDGSLALRLGFRLVKGLSEHSAAKIVAGRDEGFTHLSQLAALALPSVSRKRWPAPMPLLPWGAIAIRSGGSWPLVSRVCLCLSSRTRSIFALKPPCLRSLKSMPCWPTTPVPD